MNGLGIGRIVHYVSHGSPDGTYPAGEHRAAVVTAIENKDMAIVTLCVLNPTGIFFNQHVQFDPNQSPGTWHWPESA